MNTDENDESSGEDPLDEDEIRDAVTQLSAAHEKAQDQYDQSIRYIASGAIAVSAGLVVKLGVGLSGAFALGFAIVSLAANLVSYETSRLGIERRMRLAFAGDRSSTEDEGWMKFTTALNRLAGLCVIAASIALLVLVVTHEATDD